MKNDSGGNYGLADTWRLNHRVNLLLLDHLSAEQLAFAANPRARSIADQFAHIRNVRILWLEHTAPKLAASPKKIDKGTATKKILQEALERSSEAMGNFIAEAEQSGTMKGSKRGPMHSLAMPWLTKRIIAARLSFILSTPNCRLTRWSAPAFGNGKKSSGKLHRFGFWPIAHEDAL